MGYYVRDQLPTTHALADAFAVCDAYYCSVMGPTWPNRFYLHGGTSHGVKDSTPIPGFKSIFDVLTLNGITNLNYFCDVPFATAAYGKVLGISPIEAFFAQAATGTLPRFSMIDPQFLGPTANDDHPDHDVRLGQALIATIYAALAKSPQWKDTLFVITYDEHGGFFDHVPPPTTVDPIPGFEQLGFRIPALCIGPFVKQGTVSTVFEHCSVLKTLALRHGLPPMNSRVAAANDFSSVIDPALIKNPRPAPALPPLEISQSKLAARLLSNPLAQDQSHTDFVLACASGAVPKHLDRRADGLGVFAEVLAWGKKLGALEITP
jgi:phospholipase C